MRLADEDLIDLAFELGLLGGIVVGFIAAFVLWLVF